MRKENKVNNRVFKNIVFAIIIVTLIIILPFIFERIILNESSWPFNLHIYLSRETWFGFIGSYLGAIGTIVLGGIAFYQNKRYEELSDQSEKRFLNLQEEMKELTTKSVSLIDLNSKIEAAKYHPILTNMDCIYYNFNNEEFEKIFDIQNDVFQISTCDTDPYVHLLSNKEIFNQYYTFLHIFKNDGEKNIRNFNCRDIKTNGELNINEGWICRACDIKPGATLICVYATKYDLVKKIINKEIDSISFTYRMENVLGECFKMSVDFQFLTEGNKIYNLCDVSYLLKINSKLFE